MTPVARLVAQTKGVRVSVARMTGAVCGALVVTAATATSAHARPATDYEMPFPCAQDWYGSTRSSHSPSVHSVDFNGPSDLGKRVVAAGAGVVTRVENLGGRSYGLYAIIDHGGGETTLYAHMKAEYVSVGQWVDRGQLVGRVGESGNVTGPHLHFEERNNGKVVAPWFHDTAFVQGSSQRSRSCDDTPLAGDWTGDGKADVGVFRRKAKGRFVLDHKGTTKRTKLFVGTDNPLVGDWNGDGETDLGMHRGTTGSFTLRTPAGNRTVTWANTSDMGVAGDWDGDGVTDLGAWRPSKAMFLLRQGDGSPTEKVRLGTPGSIPVTGDWNADGRTDLATFTAGTWRMWLEEKSGATWSASYVLGSAGDLPVTGDWNGDGATDLGVWSPATATFTMRKAQPKSLRPGRRMTTTFGRAR